LLFSEEHGETYSGAILVATVVVAAGAEGICEGGMEALFSFVRSESSCGIRESTRMICLANSIEGDVFFRSARGDCLARESRGGGLGGDAWLGIFGVSRGADKQAAFAGEDVPTVNSPRGCSDKPLRGKS